MIRPVSALLVSLLTLGWALNGAPATAMPTGDGNSVTTRHLRAPADGRAGSPTDSRADAASRSSARVPSPDAFEVRVTRVRPAVLPRKGAVTLTGTVTNLTAETRTGLNVHPLSSYAPFTTTDELAAAAAAAPEITFGGQRLQDVGVLDNSIEELAPGASKKWQVRIPVEKLEISGGEGVYVLGVQVLSDDDADGARDKIADGRARTFIPRVNPGRTPTPTSLVVPLRNPVTRTADGRVDNESDWHDELSAGGRLANLIDLIRGHAELPLSVVVDPAVLAAVQQLADANPARSIAPTITEADAGETDEETDTEPDSNGETGQGEVSADAEHAQAWLDDAVAALSTHDVLALPYGDLDVAAASHRGKAFHDGARAKSKQVMTGLGISSSPGVVPPSGQLPTEALAKLTDATVLLSTRALPEEYADDSVAPVGLTLGAAQATLFADVTTGADPADPDSAVGIRQRVLSEAALRTLSGAGQPLVVNLPAGIDPGAHAESLLNGLDADFVRLAPLSSVLTDSAPDSAPVIAEVDQLHYTQHQSEAELSSALFAMAGEVTDRGNALDGALTRNDQIGPGLAAEALTGLSVHSRADQGFALGRLRTTRDWVTERLAKIELSAPSFVILSSASGPFSVTVRNGLDQPVSFAIRAETTEDVEIKAPATIDLDPLASQNLTLNARAKNIGVHQVTLVVTTEDGIALGGEDVISIRSNQVGKVIWVVIGVGVGILFLAIGIRLIRRFRKTPAS